MDANCIDGFVQALKPTDRCPISNDQENSKSMFVVKNGLSRLVDLLKIIQHKPKSMLKVVENFQ